jgi:hypothetical protein
MLALPCRCSQLLCDTCGRGQWAAVTDQAKSTNIIEYASIRPTIHRAT